MHSHTLCRERERERWNKTGEREKESILVWDYIVFGFLVLEGVGMPLGLGPIPTPVWAEDAGEIGLLAGLGM